MQIELLPSPERLGFGSENPAFPAFCPLSPPSHLPAINGVTPNKPASLLQTFRLSLSNDKTLSGASRPPSQPPFRN